MFEIVRQLTVESMTSANGETEHPAHAHIEVANPWMRNGGPRKIVLPRYYHTSRTGVLASWYPAPYTEPIR